MISWVAMDRIVERKRASDAAYHKQVAGRPLRSDAKLLSDGDLLAKLRSFGIDLDRSSLEQLCGQAFSAEEIAKPLLDRHTFQRSLLLLGEAFSPRIGDLIATALTHRPIARFLRMSRGKTYHETISSRPSA